MTSILQKIPFLSALTARFHKEAPQSAISVEEIMEQLPSRLSEFDRKQWGISPVAPWALSIYSTMRGANEWAVSLLDYWHVPLKKYLSKAELALLKKNAREVMLQQLYSTLPSEKCTKGTFADERKLGELLMPHIEFQPNERIYLPYAGTLGLIAQFPPHLTIEGFEMRALSWAASEIFLYASGRTASIEFGDFEAPSNQYDKIVVCLTEELVEEAFFCEEMQVLLSQNLVATGELLMLAPRGWEQREGGWQQLLDFVRQQAGLSLTLTTISSTGVETSDDDWLLYTVRRINSSEA